MSGTTHREWNWSEGLITALAVGGFLVILGVVFGLTPGIPQKIILFFTDLTGAPYPSASSQFVYLHLQILLNTLMFMVQHQISLLE